MSSRQQHYRATILPVPPEIPRPRWSVMIPTHNCADYLRETLASVLAQDPGPALMQIEVIDDYSTKDDPAAVVAELGRGRVAFYRQPENVGHTRNFSTCLQRSRGTLVHLLHGDDCVRDGFYSKMGRLFEGHPELGAAFCRYIYMDAQGHWQWLPPVEQAASGVLENWLERLVTQQPLQPPAMVVRRDVYEQVGGFDQRLVISAEDTEMWIRIGTHYPVGYEVEPLALYRTQLTTSLTSRAIRNGQNIRDCRRARELYRAYLPAAVADDYAERANKPIVRWALLLAYDRLAVGDIRTALVQAREALKCSHSPEVIGRILKLFIGAGVRRIWRSLHAT